MNEYGVTFRFSKVIMRVEEAGSKKKKSWILGGMKISRDSLKICLAVANFGF